MDLHDRRALKGSARDCLAAAAYDPRKIILLHTGITIAVSLFATILNFILSRQIQNTGGLGGLGLRSVLSTAQSVLQVAVAVLIPFWEAGYCYATMRIARGEEANPDCLLQGFRRFGPLLRVTFAKLLIYFGIGLFCFFLGYYIFMLTPLSDPLYAIIETISLDPTMLETEVMLDDATFYALMDAYQPMLLIILALFAVFGIFVSYRYRMATFLILDHPQLRGMETLRISTYQLRGQTKALLKLDISFLWFYVLNWLSTALAYGDYVLAVLGISFPFPAEIAYFGFLILSLVCQGSLFLWARNRVDVTYARFYQLTALPFYKKGDEPDSPENT